VLFSLWLFLFLLGGNRTQDQRKAGSASETRSEPVLKIEDDAKTIISKAVKAHGGEKAFSRRRCGYLKYKTKGGVVPKELGEVIVEDTFQLPDYFRRVTHLAVGGKEMLMVFVVNRGKGWVKEGDSPATPIPVDFAERPQHPFANFCNVSLLTEAGEGLTKLGAEKVNGKDAIRIRAQSDELGQVDFYFATQTGLLLKSRKLRPGADPGKPAVVESFLDDYKDAQGTQVPMRMKVAHDGKLQLDVTLIEAKFADKFEESVFAKP
jgi:hypothetical protein